MKNILEATLIQTPKMGFKPKSLMALLAIAVISSNISTSVQFLQNGWLTRSWACQANFFAQLQAAQANNPKAQVTAPINGVSSKNKKQV